MFLVLKSLEEEALYLELVRNALDGDEERRAAHLHVVLLRVVPDSLEVVLHNRDEAVVVLFLGPEESGEVLYPLEVGADDSAAVREEVGNDENSTLVEDGVALGTDGSVRAFDYVLALKQRGVLLADDAFKGAGRKDEAFLLEYLFAVHLDEARLRITVEDALRVLLDVGLRGFDVDAVRVVVAAGDVADSDYLAARVVQEQRVVGSDVAEALYDDGGVLRVDVLSLEQFKNAGGDAESGRRGASLGAPVGDGLTGDYARLEVAAELRNGVHDPDHLGAARVDVGSGNVGPVADKRSDARREGAGHHLALARRELKGVYGNSALAAAVRNTGERALPGHKARKSLALFKVDVRVETEAALRRSADRRVLYAITFENSNRAVVHLDGDGDADSALRAAQYLDEAIFKPHLLGRIVEVLECGVEKYVFGSTFLYGHTKNPLSFFARLGRRHKIFVPQDLIFTHNNIVCPNTFLVKGGARRNIYINDRKYRHIYIIRGMPCEKVRGHAQSRAQIYKNNFTSTTAKTSPGSMFIILIFIRPSRFTPIAISISPPAALISQTAASVMNGWSTPAASVRAP